MQYMNDHDLAFALRRFNTGRTPNRLAVARMVTRLAEWTNANSDGWAYWQAPRKAANRAMTEVNSTTNAANHAQESTDLTNAAVTSLTAPIKAFLTRRNVPQSDRDYILRGN